MSIMIAEGGPGWFVVRTKAHKEQLAYNELLRQTIETFLPLLKAPLPVYGRLAWVRTRYFRAICSPAARPTKLSK